MAKNNFVILCVIFVVSLFIFTRFLDHHGLEYRDDEIFYFQSTQEMLQNHDYLSPTYFGENRFQKPILFYWLILLSYKIFGNTWFAARLIAAIFAALTVCCTWVLAKELFNNKRLAYLSAVILVSFPLFFRHAKNAVPDMVLNFFIVASIFYGYKLLTQKEGKATSVNFFILCALGFMIKGFAAIIVPFAVLIIFAWVSGKKGELQRINLLPGIGIFLVIVLPWFLYMVYRHGHSFTDFVLIGETKNRLLSANRGFSFKGIGTFIQHLMFYLRVILSYFAPWSAFLAIGLPFIISDIKRQRPEKDALQLLLIWVAVVYIFFSGMNFLINHYMLVLSTPLAILVGYFFLRHRRENGLAVDIIYGVRKYLAVFLFSAGCLAYMFLVVFLLQGSWMLLLILLPLTIWLARMMVKSRNPITVGLVLSGFIVFTYAQSALLNKAGITSHAVLEKFAQTIETDRNQYVVGVGSHDIHEKEFQVYFKEPVIKAATSLDHETNGLLMKLFSRPQDVFCLMTQKDLDELMRRNPNPPSLEIVQRDLMFRRRLNLDQGFLSALVRFDQKTIQHYLKEEVVLVKKRKSS